MIDNRTERDIKGQFIFLIAHRARNSARIRESILADSPLEDFARIQIDSCKVSRIHCVWMLKNPKILAKILPRFARNQLDTCSICTPGPRNFLMPWPWTIKQGICHSLLLESVNMVISLFEEWWVEKERACFKLDNELSRKRLPNLKHSHHTSKHSHHTSKRLIESNKIHELLFEFINSIFRL